MADPGWDRMGPEFADEQRPFEPDGRSAYYAWASYEPEAARNHILDAERRLVRVAGAFGLVRTCVVDEIRSGGLK